MNIIMTDEVTSATTRRLIKRLLQACISENLLPYTIEQDFLFIHLKESKKIIILTNIHCFKLAKWRIDGEAILLGHHQFYIITEIKDLLDLIQHEVLSKIKTDQWPIFIDEMDNCLNNDRLVNYYMEKFNHQLAEDIIQFNCNSLIEYIDLHYATAEQLIFFERWASRGHPYHPCHKTKLGFDSNDYLRYSPEFSQDIHLFLTAIDKSLMHVESEQGELDYCKWFADQFPTEWQNFRKKIKAQGLEETTYYPIFIHPWQYKNIIISLFKNLLKKNQLIRLDDTAMTTKASLSFRTMIVKNDSTKPHIKIPVAIHSTSAMRTNSPSSAENGPRLSTILREILKTEKQLNGHLKIAYESCSLHFNDVDHEVAKHLGIIYRKNPIDYLEKKQIPIVAAALYELSPIKQLPLFIELVNKAVGHTLANAVDYFDRYCQIVVHAYLDLFLVYGIALEGHQQNTIAVFENYHPIFMIARDLGGSRIHAQTLRNKGFDFKPYPNSEIIVNHSLEVTNKFLHTVIHSHLGEIILLLAQYYQTNENIFWKIIKNNLTIRFQKLKNNTDLGRWQQEYKAIFNDDWQVKSLLSMRLNNLSKKYIYVTLENPLRDIK